MAAGKLQYFVEVDSKDGIVEFSRIGKAFDNIGGRAEKAGIRGGKAVDTLGLKITNLNQLLEIGKKAFHLFSLPLEKLISIGSKFEDLRLQLDTVLQSAEKGEAYFEWIKQFSSTTPFQIEGLTETVILLENFGINGRQYLRTFGDAAAGLKIPMKDLGLVMGQIWTKPTAQAEEMLQLMERGIPVTKILKEELGLTAAQVGDIGRQGIEGKKVFEALASGMEKLYGGAMSKMSKTWTGMMSTLKDKFALFVGQVAGPVLEKLKGKLDNLLARIDTWAKDGTLEKVAGQIADFISGLVDTIGKIVSTIWQWRDAIIFAGKAWLLYFSVSKLNVWGKAFSGVISGLSGSLTGLGGKFTNMGRMFEKLRERGHGVFTSLSGSLTQISPRIRGLTGSTGLLKTALKNVGSVAGAAFAGWQIGRLIGRLTGLDKVVHKVFDSLLNRSQEYYDRASQLKNMTQDQVDFVKLIEQTKELASSYGIQENNLKKLYLALYENKEAYSQLDPEMKKYVDQTYQKHQALMKTQAALQATKKVQVEAGKGTAAAVQIEAKYLELMQKHGLTLENARKLYVKLNPEMAETIKLAKELNITEAAADEILTEKYKAGQAEYKQLQDKIKQQNQFQSSLLITNEHLSQNAESYGWASEAAAKTTQPLEASASAAEKVQYYFSRANEAINFMSGLLSQLGIDMDGLLGHLFELGSGLSRIASGDILGGVSSVVSGVVGAFRSLTAPDWGKRARKALSGFEGVSEDMEKQLEELSRELGSTEAAFRSLLAEFIEAANITSYEGFAGWAKEVEELADLLDNLTANAEEYNKIMQELKDSDSWAADKLLEQMPEVEETASQLEESFDSLLKKAQELGYEGSAAFLSVLEKAKALREEGYNLAGVSEYIMDELKGGIDAFGSYIKDAADVAAKIAETEAALAGMKTGSKEWREANEELTKLKEQFGNVSNEESFSRALQYATGFMTSLEAEGKSMMEIASIMGPQLKGLLDIAQAGGYDTGGLTELLKLNEFVTKNQEVMNSIDASTKMLQSFGNSGYLTADLFKGFQQDAQDYYAKLTKETGNETQALQAMLPYLAQMKYYAEANNLELDEHTRKLLADAEAQGMNLDGMKSQQQLQQEMNQSLQDLVKIMSEFTGITTGSTKALQNMASTASASFSAAAAGAKNLQNQMRNISSLSGEPDVPQPLPDVPIPAFAKGTDGWREVTKNTIIRVGEGNQKEFLNVVTEKDAIRQAKTAKKNQEKIKGAQIALLQAAENDMLNQARQQSEVMSKVQVHDDLKGKGEIVQEAQQSLMQKANSQMEPEKAEIKIEPKYTPQLPVVNVNVAAAGAGNTKEKEKKDVSLISQNQLHVKVEQAGDGPLNEEKLATLFARIMQDDTKESYNKLYLKMKEDFKKEFNLTQGG